MTAPVYDQAAEQAVLANILLTPAIVRPLIGDIDLRPDEFWLDSHQDIYRAMLELHDSEDGIDQQALARRLSTIAARNLALALGAEYAAGAWRSHAKRVKECARYERTRRAAEQLEHGAASQDDDLIAEAERLLTEPSGQYGGTVSPKQLQDRLTRLLDDERPAVMALPWRGINDLIVGGMWPGRYMLVGGYGKHGKSCAVDGALENFSALGKNVAVYLTETTVEERGQRAIARHGAYDYGVVQRFFNAPKNRRDPATRRQLDEIRTSLPEVHYVEAHDWTVGEICRHIAHSGWDACAVDILHDIPLPRGGGMSTTDAYQEVGRALLQTAKKTRTAMLVAVHLNDNRVDEFPPQPVNRDIRGCGMLYRQADVVLMVHQEEDQDGPTGEGVLRVTACRQGQTGTIRARFDGAHQRWLAPAPAYLERVA